MKYIVDLKDVSLRDVNKVGGKNASTGEMLGNLSRLNVLVPNGFALTTDAYRHFLRHDNLQKKIEDIIKHTNEKNLVELNKASIKIKRLIMATPIQKEIQEEILTAYSHFKQASVAVRSSATLEDSASISFAGQQETYLNIKGEKNVLNAIKLVYASLFNSRAISYRRHHKVDNERMAISVGVQPMIRSDKSVSGVMFTMDTESGFDQVILITASYGLGEGIVQGAVSPDEFYVYKPSLEQGNFSILQRKLGEKLIKMIYAGAQDPARSVKSIPVNKADRMRFCLTDAEIEKLAKHALAIEKHYKKPMDIEWGKDGITGELYILQARPETVKSQENQQILERFELSKPGKMICKGQSVGQKIGQGKAKIIKHAKDISQMEKGGVLVTDMTDPDWEPIMKLASAIVTNRGGRTCHAAIVARELGIPAVVGCVDATSLIKRDVELTVSCAEGQTGFVYQGNIPFKVKRINVKSLPSIPVDICVNMGNPSKAFSTQFIPNAGVGLARLEFIISTNIGIHPNAALQYKKLPQVVQKEVAARIQGYADPVTFYVEKLREGIATIAAAFSPKPVIFRFSDFKSNEYANLIGGKIFEPQEENPMIGFRGASRYVSESFRDCFELECKAIKLVREKMGLTNTKVMIPFVRTVAELQAVLKLMAKYGLKRGEKGLEIYMMCEIPSNVILAEEFLVHVDGYSIGSNDLTQLTLGLDRDSYLVSDLFDERNEAIKQLLQRVISYCNEQQKYIGICGQGPSDHADLAAWLVKQKIQCMSLNADTIVDTWLMLAKQR